MIGKIKQFATKKKVGIAAVVAAIITGVAAIAIKKRK